MIRVKKILIWDHQLLPVGEFVVKCLLFLFVVVLWVFGFKTVKDNVMLVYLQITFDK